jgi:hypothetical protein
MVGELLEAERVHSIVGAFFTVYNYYGYGLRPQLISYLRASQFSVGVLLHFGPTRSSIGSSTSPSAQAFRFVNIRPIRVPISWAHPSGRIPDDPLREFATGARSKWPTDLEPEGHESHEWRRISRRKFGGTGGSRMIAPHQRFYRLIDFPKHSGVPIRHHSSNFVSPSAGLTRAAGTLTDPPSEFGTAGNRIRHQTSEQNQRHGITSPATCLRWPCRLRPARSPRRCALARAGSRRRSACAARRAPARNQ